MLNFVYLYFHGRAKISPDRCGKEVLHHSSATQQATLLSIQRGGVNKKSSSDLVSSEEPIWGKDEP